MDSSSDYLTAVVVEGEGVAGGRGLGSSSEYLRAVVEVVEVVATGGGVDSSSDLGAVVVEGDGVCLSVHGVRVRYPGPGGGHHHQQHLLKVLLLFIELVFNHQVRQSWIY